MEEVKGSNVTFLASRLIASKMVIFTIQMALSAWQKISPFKVLFYRVHFYSQNKMGNKM